MVEKETPCFGPEYNLEQRIKTHLFILSPNNSGSTFLKNALATSQHTWNLKREGQHAFGFQGPSTRRLGAQLLWTTRQEWLDAFQEPNNFNWKKNRETWYFQAQSRDPEATIFVEKSPPFLLCAKQLQAHFCNCKFLLLVRNPYAVCEGIVRRWERHKNMTRERALSLAAEHILNCFEIQAKNISELAECSVFFHYEEMCESPRLVEAKVRELCAKITDLDLSQSLPIKGIYNEPLRNMNEQQIERLSSADLCVLNEVFADRRELLEQFGYAIIRNR